MSTHPILAIISLVFLSQGSSSLISPGPTPPSSSSSPSFRPSLPSSSSPPSPSSSPSFRPLAPSSSSPSSPPLERGPSRIVNGQEAAPHSWPSQVSLQQVSNDGSWSHFCGGVLLAPGVVLTAAHCVYVGWEPKYRVVCGRHDLSVDEPSSQVAAVAQLYRHPLYDPNQSRPHSPNDIAKLHLANPFTLSPECQTARLPGAEHWDYAGSPAVITGWGRVYGGGPLSTRLLEGQVEVVSPEACGRYHGQSVDKDLHICLKDLGDKVFGACQGDSGGPAHVGETVVGISSFVRGNCLTSYPSVYVRLSNYIQWINSSLN